jgi:hypothetical protein
MGGKQVKAKHLERAREFLAIAESGDAKREAYMRAAEEIAAHRADTKESMSSIAILLGCSAEKVRKLMQWRDTQYKAATPFLMDTQATARAAHSHAKRVLSDPATRQALLNDLDPEVRTHLAMEAREVPPHEPPLTPTGADYSKEPVTDPSNYEIDHLVMDVARRVHVIRDRVRKYGVRTLDKAAVTLSDLDAAITDLGEVRAAVHEHVNEEALT